jgi:5-methylcytosine-specific restriction protein B
MLRFAALVGQARESVSDDTVLDYLVLQKVLPRVHGSARELSSLMADLRRFTTSPSEAEDGDGAQPRLPLAADKLARMTAELDATHFTAF